MIIRGFLLTLGALLFGLAVGQDATPGDQIAQAWGSAYNEGNPSAVADLYSSDFVLLPPDQQATSDREGLTATVQAYLDAGAVEIDLHSMDEFQALGETAWGTGQYTLFDAEGNEVGLGKFLIVYVQEDGDWKIHRHMWNSNVPPPQPEE